MAYYFSFQGELVELLGYSQDVMRVYFTWKSLVLFFFLAEICSIEFYHGHSFMIAHFPVFSSILKNIFKNTLYGELISGFPQDVIPFDNCEINCSIKSWFNITSFGASIVLSSFFWVIKFFLVIFLLDSIVSYSVVFPLQVIALDNYEINGSIKTRFGRKFFVILSGKVTWWFF